MAFLKNTIQMFYFKGNCTILSSQINLGYVYVRFLPAQMGNVTDTITQAHFYCLTPPLRISHSQ